MDEPGFEDDFLSASRVAIAGLGLMGGSLAMALRGKVAGLVGIDADPAAAEQALERGIVDRAGVRMEGLLDGVDLIVLAAPVRSILEQLADLDMACPRPAVVIDLGSTKASIVKAMARLPERFDPVGGHPMCGKEKSSLQYAEASIYTGAPFALVSLQRTSARARRAAEALARAVGACPLWIDAQEHDRWVAATSHAPFLLASALASATPADVKPLVGPGFLGAARLAGSSPRMMIDILSTNTENVRTAVRAIREQLDQYEALLAAGDFDALAERIEEARDKYQDLI